MTLTTKQLQQAGSREAETTQGGIQFTPRIDIVEYEQELVLSADLPGVTPENLDIQYEEGQLTLHGKVTPRTYGKQCRVAEYEVGDFYRTFRIGERATFNVRAEFSNIFNRTQMNNPLSTNATTAATKTRRFAIPFMQGIVTPHPPRKRTFTIARPSTA